MKTPAGMLILIALLGAAWQVSEPAWADDAAARDYAIKAALICRFVQFVDWPSSMFASDTDPIIIATVGDDPFHGSLEEVVAGKTIGNRPLVVRHFSSTEAIDRCHVLFVAPPDSDDMPRVWRKLGRAAVLTIGETENFCHDGGIIQFIIQDQKTHFLIRVDAASQRGVTINSQLLKLASLYAP